MTHEINIYGDIVPFKWWDDGTEFDLSDLNNILNQITPEKGDELLININTFGGCTTTAFAIYNKLLNFKNKNEISLTTRVDGYCASSGVILLLAGDKRVGNAYAEPFIHNAWTWTIGDKNEHKKQMEDLQRVDDQIATLYAERTKIDKAKAIELMNADGYVKSEDALNYGFYTELENVYSVENSIIFNSLKSQNSKNRQKIQNNMSEKNRQSTWNKLKNQIDDFFKGTKNKIVFTADNSELDFYELGEDETPKAKDGDTAGDKAKYDGKPAGESNNGEYVMPSGETYKFEGEELVEIIAKEEETDENEALQNENAELKTEVENLKKEVKDLKSEKSALNTKLNEAKSIIKNFKKEMEEDDENDDKNPEKKRNSKTNPSGNRNLFKYVK